MEEDIKILEEMKANCIKGMMKGAIYTDEKAERKALAIENLIKRCRELEEKNRRYEEIYKEYGIDDLVKRINELEEFKKQVTEIESTNFIKYKNYIPKSKVKELIETYSFTEHNGSLTISLKALNELTEDK